MVFRRVIRRIEWEIRKRNLAHWSQESTEISEGTILFFAPEAGVLPHYGAHLAVAHSLRSLGHSVAFATCFRCFSRCPVMDSRVLPTDLPAMSTRQLCIACATTAKGLLDEWKMPRISLAQYQDKGLAETVEKILASFTNLYDVEHDGIQFGQMSAMNVTLKEKIHDFQNVSSDAKAFWRKVLESTLNSYLLMGRILDSQPIKAIVTFNDYALFLGSRIQAERRKTPVFTITHAYHRGIDRRYLEINRSVGIVEWLDKEGGWDRVRHLPVSTDSIREVFEDIRDRAQGAQPIMYSLGRRNHRVSSIYHDLRLDPAKKTIVAFNSSYDEYISSQMLMQSIGETPRPIESLFNSQEEWIESLIQYVSKKNDVQLIIRIHPRLGKNRREGKISEALLRLKTLLKDVPAQCRVIWPEESISTYDLFDIIDVSAVYFSTVCIEAARIGIPTLMATRGISPYPVGSFLHWAPDQESYFKKLDHLLSDKQGSTPQSIVEAFRCYLFFHLGRSVDLSDHVPEPGFSGLPSSGTYKAAKIIEQILVKGISPTDLYQKRLESEKNSARLESLEIARCLEELLGVFSIEKVSRTPLSQRMARLIKELRSWEGPVERNEDEVSAQVATS